MMRARAILSLRRAILIGVLSFLGLVSAASQELTESERAIIGPSTGQGSTTASAPTHIASGAASTPADTGPILQGSIATSNPLWAIPLTSLTSTRERPIFSPTRRPSAVAESAPPAPSAPSPSANRPLFALVGAIAGEDDGIAIFQDETTKDVIRMRIGESHLGWTLRLVKGREATLQNELKTAILALPNPTAK